MLRLSGQRASRGTMSLPFLEGTKLYSLACELLFFPFIDRERLLLRICCRTL